MKSGGPGGVGGNGGGGSGGYRLGSNDEGGKKIGMDPHGGVENGAHENHDALGGTDSAVRDELYAMKDKVVITESPFDGRAIYAFKSMRHEVASAR